MMSFPGMGEQELCMVIKQYVAGMNIYLVTTILTRGRASIVEIYEKLESVVSWLMSASSVERTFWRT